MVKMPKRGDIVFVDVEPHMGKEYGGHDVESGNIRRPLIVLSNSDYNFATGMIIGMVVTSRDFSDSTWYRSFADFESGVKGNIVLWQLPTYDFAARNGEVVGHASDRLIKSLRQSAIEIFS